MNTTTLAAVIVMVVLAAIFAVFVLRREQLPQIKNVFVPFDRMLVFTVLFLPVIIIVMYTLQGTRFDSLTLFRRSILLFFGYIVSVEDFKTKRIPNGFVLGMMAVWLFSAVPQLFMDTEAGVAYLISAGLGFLVGGGLFLLVYFISKRGLGGGDVKFMAAAGLYLGLNGVLPVMLYGSVLSAIVGIALILLKRLGRKDAMPLAPFLYIGILITMLML